MRLRPFRSRADTYRALHSPETQARGKPRSRLSSPVSQTYCRRRGWLNKAIKSYYNKHLSKNMTQQAKGLEVWVCHNSRPFQVLAPTRWPTHQSSHRREIPFEQLSCTEIGLGSIRSSTSPITLQLQAMLEVTKGYCYRCRTITSTRE